MKYQISTLSQLKAAVFDAIEKGVVLDARSLESFATFDSAVSDYIEYCSEETRLVSRRVCGSTRTRLAWFKELKAAPAVYGVGLVFNDV